MVGHSSDLVAWRKCGDNQVAGEGTPKGPAPHCYSPVGGLEQSPRELGGETSRARGEANSPRKGSKGILWAGQPAGTGQGSHQWEAADGGKSHPIP